MPSSLAGTGTVNKALDALAKRGEAGACMDLLGRMTTRLGTAPDPTSFR
jgi:pentatricopeptide repeat protein